MKTNREKVSKPLICLIDTAVAVNTALTEYGLTISSGTLGTRVDISADTAAPYRTVRCLPNYSVPPNLQEYDIVVVDMNEDEGTKRYVKDEHERPHISGDTSTFFISEYPDALFDPRPIGASRISYPIKEVVNKGGILIVFLGRNYALITHLQILLRMVRTVPDRKNIRLMTSYPSIYTPRISMGSRSSFRRSESLFFLVRKAL